MENVLIGIIIGVVSSAIFFWFSKQSENRAKVIFYGTKLRNILYNMEFNLSLDLKPPLIGNYSFPLLIEGENLDRLQWFIGKIK